MDALQQRHNSIGKMAAFLSYKKVSMRYFPQGLSFKVTSSEQLSLSISLCILPLCNYSLSQQIVSLIRLTTIDIFYCSYLFLVFLSHILPCRGKDYSDLLHRCTRSIWHNFCHRVGV